LVKAMKVRHWHLHKMHRSTTVKLHVASLLHDPAAMLPVCSML